MAPGLCMKMSFLSFPFPSLPSFLCSLLFLETYFAQKEFINDDGCSDGEETDEESIGEEFILVDFDFWVVWKAVVDEFVVSFG